MRNKHTKSSTNSNLRLNGRIIESVLLYGAETWTVTKDLEKTLNGCYTRMLRMASNVSWKDHMTNEELYGDLPPVTLKIRQRKLRLAGHCWRHKEEIASDLVLWEPLDGKRKRGRQRTTYVDNLLDDTGLDNTKELSALIQDRTVWWNVVADVGQSWGILALLLMSNE